MENYPRDSRNYDAMSTSVPTHFLLKRTRYFAPNKFNKENIFEFSSDMLSHKIQDFECQTLTELLIKIKRCLSSACLHSEGGVWNFGWDLEQSNFLPSVVCCAGLRLLLSYTYTLKYYILSIGIY